jgi:isoleucyl-tRNA synthetase
VIVAAGTERSALERFEGQLLDELNIKRVRFVSEAEELGRWELKPNYRSLGPRFGKRMPQVAEAVAALDAQSAAATLRDGGTVGLAIDGHDHELTADDVQLVLQPLEGYQVERSGTHAVALNLALDDGLRREGLAREAVRAIQEARKSAGLNVEDRIRLTLGGDTALVAAVREHEEYVAGETLATGVTYRDGALSGEPVKIEGRELSIGVERA